MRIYALSAGRRLDRASEAVDSPEGNHEKEGAMAGNEGLGHADLRRVEAIERDVQDAALFLSQLGDGGWNHGAKVIAAVDEAKAMLDEANKRIGDVRTMSS
jgi:hypothetical protein